MSEESTRQTAQPEGKQPSNDESSMRKWLLCYIMAQCTGTEIVGLVAFFCSHDWRAVLVFQLPLLLLNRIVYNLFPVKETQANPLIELFRLIWKR